MKIIDLIGSIGAILLIVYFLKRALKGMHKPSEQRKEDISNLQDSIKQMREDLEKLKKS